MEVNIKISIPKRYMDAVKQYCLINNLTLEAYISNCIVTQNNIDRYGDLNHNSEIEILDKKNTSKKEINNYVVNHKIEHFEKPDEVINHTNLESLEVEDKQQKEENKSAQATTEIKPQIKRRRTIKSK